MSCWLKWKVEVNTSIFVPVWRIRVGKTLTDLDISVGAWARKKASHALSTACAPKIAPGWCGLTNHLSNYTTLELGNGKENKLETIGLGVVTMPGRFGLNHLFQDLWTEVRKLWPNFLLTTYTERGGTLSRKKEPRMYSWILSATKVCVEWLSGHKNPSLRSPKSLHGLSAKSTFLLKSTSERGKCRFPEPCGHSRNLLI